MVYGADSTICIIFTDSIGISLLYLLTVLSLQIVLLSVTFCYLKMSSHSKDHDDKTEGEELSVKYQDGF